MDVTADDAADLRRGIDESPQPGGAAKAENVEIVEPRAKRRLMQRKDRGTLWCFFEPGSEPRKILTIDLGAGPPRTRHIEPDQRTSKAS
jgi:hypothetical protein